MSTTTPSRRTSTTPSVQITDPFSLMRQEMNELISNMWNGNREGLFGAGYVPALDVSEKQNNFELRMDVPGMEAKDLDIKVQGNTVTVSGHRKEEKEEKGKTYHRTERRSGSFSRTITLPCNITEKEVAAEYTNGVLTVVLPKCEESKGHRIQVKG